MKGKKPEKNLKKTISLSLVIIILLLSGGGFVYAYQSGNSTNETAQAETKNNSSDTAENQIVSGEGTLSANTIKQMFEVSLDSDTPLTVEKVYVSAGDTVKKGDTLLKVTDDSLSSAKTALQKAVDEATTALNEASVDYSKEKLEAEYTYLSESGLNESAKTEYEASIESLEETVDEAKENLTEVKTIISTYPSVISDNETQVKSLAKQLSSLEESLKSAKSTLSIKEKTYQSKTKSYQEAITNLLKVTAAYVYLAEEAGENTKQIEQVYSELVTNLQGLTTNSPSTENTNQENSGSDDSSAQKGEMPSAGESESKTAKTSTSSLSGGIIALSSTQPDKVQEETQAQNQTDNQETTKADSKEAESTLLKTIKNQYSKLSQTYEKAKTAYEKAKSAYESANTKVNHYTTKISENEKSTSELETENEQKESELSKAKEELSDLQTAYTTAVNNQVTQMVTIEADYQSQMITYESAKSNYDITLASIEADYQSYQDALTSAKENLSLLNELKKGKVTASQAGTISSFGYLADDYLDTTNALVTYLDTSAYSITVSVSQSEITNLSVGDSAVVYVSDSNSSVNGTISSIAPQTQENSVTNVTYNVTVSLSKDIENLTDGSSAVVYFGDAATMMTNQKANQTQKQTQKEGDGNE